MRVLRAAGLAGLLSLVVAGPAGAATIEVTSTSGPAAEEYIAFTAGRGERNRVTVTESGRQLIFTDTGARLRGRSSFFGVCRNASPNRVACPRFAVVAALGDGNDRIDLSAARFGGTTNAIPTDPVGLIEYHDDTEGGLERSVDISAGDGDDVVVGSGASDDVFPGRGRDRVDTGDGGDRVANPPDGAPDVLRGGRGLNDLALGGGRAVTVSTRAGRVTAAGGERDSIKGFRRIHGSSRGDRLTGGSAGEALYGEGGDDRIDGGDGADLLVGDGPFVTGEPGAPRPSRNRLTAGAGDDVVDARSFGTGLVPTSAVDCGPGGDRVAADVDDRLDVSCESAVARINSREAPDGRQSPFWRALIPPAPVARLADGSLVYDLECPTAPRFSGELGRCTGNVFLERPPAPGGAAGERLGTGAYDIPSGERRNVTVALTPAGRAAAAPGAVLAVHVVGTASLRQPTPGAELERSNFGWQRALP